MAGGRDGYQIRHQSDIGVRSQSISSPITLGLRARAESGAHSRRVSQVSNSNGYRVKGCGNETQIPAARSACGWEV